MVISNNQKKIFDNRIDDKEHECITKLLNKKELANLFNVSIPTIDRWVVMKKIPYIKLESWLVRFDMAEIKEWLKERSTYNGY